MENIIFYDPRSRILLWFRTKYNADSPLSSNRTVSLRRRCCPSRSRSIPSQRFRSWACCGIFARAPDRGPRNGDNGVDPVTGSKPIAVGLTCRQRSSRGRCHGQRANVSSARRRPERRRLSCRIALGLSGHLSNPWTSPRGPRRTRSRRSFRTIYLSPSDRRTGTSIVLETYSVRAKKIKK